MSELATSPTQMFAVFDPGTMLGRYELVATIGEGGMAKVILARQRGPAGFEKVVVIKVIHPQMAGDRDAVGMLLDEARVAAAISHPHVVQTFELGETNGTYFIAMEYLAGESLQRVLKSATMNNSLDPRMAARIVADAADGLHAAHELCDLQGRNLGLVHRDVSLGNIVILYNGCVKVVDFGIAKTQNRVGANTEQGQLKGKYSYMSPEQIHGEPLDRRSDVFSLGVVLWECLTLRRLFLAPNVPATLMQILSGERVPPSRIRPEVPPSLDAIALKALAVNKHDRFQTAEEMKRALEDAIWQSRCSMSDIQNYMTAMFGDRMRRRQALLASCSSAENPSIEIDVEDVGFDETSGIRPTTSVAVQHEKPSSPVISSAERPSPPTDHAAPPPAPPPAPPIVAMQPPAQPLQWLPPNLRPSQPTIGNPGVLGPQGVESARLSLAPARPSVPETARPIRWFRVAIAIGAVLGGLGFLVSQLVPRPPDSSPTIAQPTPAPNQPPPAAQKPPEPNHPPTAPPQPTSPTQAVVHPVPANEDDIVVATARSRLRPEHLEPYRFQPDPQPSPTSDQAATRPPGAGSSATKPSAQEVKKLYAKAAQLFASQKYVDAEGVFKQILALNPSSAAAYRGLGFIYKAMGLESKAIASFRRYLRLAPNANDADIIRERIEEIGGA